jgi:DNA-binding response OmpR family regulator
MLYSLKKQLSVSDIHLLIASADIAAVRNIFNYLEPMGYQLDSASSSDEVRLRLGESAYDALVLDALLADINGIPLYTCLRMEHIKTPMILLVPENTMENLPRYLNSGADDIVTSPLHLLELEARILANIRLAKSQNSSARLQWAGLELDTQAHTVSCNGSPFHLPPMAFTILTLLMKAAPNVVSRAELENYLYGNTPPTSDALRTYIHILRSTLEKQHLPILQTVPRIGFRLIQYP